MKKMYLFPLVAFLLMVVICVIAGPEKAIANDDSTGTFTKYFCDVKNIAFNTSISVTNETTKSEVGTISGNIIKFITDPLEMKKDDVVIAKADDNYNFITQDDHAIIVNGEYQFTVHGEFDVLGESYTILDSENNEIANIEFNMTNTNGVLYDNDGKKIAQYESSLLRKDYTVIVYDNTELNHDGLLLLFASYYSDQAADNKTK